MFFRKIDFQAYGPFSNCHLDLSSNPKSLHIIYGPNEAGKSSALDAIVDFLFGFPARSSAAFVHQNRDLRIGAQIETSEGDVHEFVRKKTGTPTLLTTDQLPADEEVLKKALNQLDKEKFQQQFGFDYQSLSAGGRELAKGQGDLASTLFAATAGSSKWNDAKGIFTEKAGKLFNPRARKVTIKEDLKEYSELEKELRSTVLDPLVWRSEQEELEGIKRELNAVEKKEKGLEKKKFELQNIEKRQPILKKYWDLNRQYEKAAFSFHLPESAANRVVECYDSIAWHSKQLAEFRSLLATLDRQLDQNDGNEILSSYQQQVSVLVSKTAEIQEVHRQWSELNLKTTEHSAQGSENLEFEVPEEILPVISRWIEHKNQSINLQKKAKIAKEQVKKYREEWTLIQIPDSVSEDSINKLDSALKSVIPSANRFFENNQELQLFRTKNQESLLQEAASLHVCFSEELGDGQFPSSKEVEIFVNRWRRLQQNQLEAASEKRKCQKRAETINEKLKSNHEVSAIQNSYKQIVTLRSQALEHLHGWLIQDGYEESTGFLSWISNLPVGIKEKCQEFLPVENQIWNQSDFRHCFVPLLKMMDQLQQETVDILVSSSDNVNFFQHLEKERNLIKEEEVRQNETLSKIEIELSELGDRWLELWENFSGKPTISDAEKILDWIERTESFLAQFSQKKQNLMPLREAYSQSLNHLMEVISSMREASEADCSDPFFQSNNEEKFKNDLSLPLPSDSRIWMNMGQDWIAKVRNRQRESEKALQAKALWKTKLDQATANLGLMESQLSELADQEEEIRNILAPIVSDERLEQVEWLAEWFHNRQKRHRKRLQQETLKKEQGFLQKQVASWCLAVSELEGLVSGLMDPGKQTVDSSLSSQGVDGNGFADGEVERSIEKLDQLRSLVMGHVRKVKNKEESSKRRLELIEKQAQVKFEVDKLSKEVNSLAGDWFDSNKTAGWGKNIAENRDSMKSFLENLKQLVTQIANERRWKQDLASCRETLLQLGVSSFDLKTQSEPESDDELQKELSNILNEQQQAKQEVKEVTERLAVKQKHIEELETSNSATKLNQKLGHLRTKIQEDIDQYLQHKLAAVLLEHSMEQYSKQQQGPILPLASKYFARLSCGGFVGITTELSKTGKQILLANRDESKTVEVSGLSEGSESQLYLAVRLAALVQLISEGRAMPLILDDVMKDYDDYRTAEALKISSEIGQQTQVLLFTHHRHLKDLATQNLAPNSFQWHEIQSGHSPSKPPERAAQRMLF